MEGGCAYGSLTAMQFSRFRAGCYPAYRILYLSNEGLPCQPRMVWGELAPTPFLFGLILSLAVAVGAWRMRALTPDGAAAAVPMGAIIFGAGGWRWAALLVLFFVTSSVLTRWQAERKSHPEHRLGRTGGQVLANGAVASLVAVWYGLAPSPLLAAAFAGAIAASTADTWATEIGLLSPSRPRLITTWRPVPPGQSGGVTWLGTFGGVAGAALIAVVASTWLYTPVIAVWIAGILAMFADSVLGATLEDRWLLIGNNSVNLIATAAGALVGPLLSR